VADPNLRDFYNRISRIETARSKGFGFEANGTLGAYYFTQRQAKKASFFGPVIAAVVIALVLKGAIHQNIGAEAHTARIDALAAGQGLDKVGAWIMHADPATLWVSQVIDKLFHSNGLGRCTANS